MSKFIEDLQINNSCDALRQTKGEPYSASWYFIEL